MKHWKQKVVFMLVISLVCLIGMPLATYAESPIAPEDIPPIEDIEQGHPDYSEGYTMAKSALTGYSTIRKVSSTSVSISATTDYPTKTTLTATAVLQWYKDGAWRDYSGGNAYVSKTLNSTTVTASKTFTVTPGYYYRARGIHIGNGGIRDSDCNGINI